MKNNVNLLAFVLLALCGSVPTACAEPEYDFFKIDSFNANPLAGYCFVWDINDEGVVCGESTMDNRIGTPGFIWTEAGGKTEVPVSHPASISNSGLVVGHGQIYNIHTQQVWTPTNLPGTYYSPSFLGVTDDGLAVGTISGCSCSDSGGVTNVPYLWDEANGSRGLTPALTGAKGLKRINSNRVALGWVGGWSGDDFYIDLTTGAASLLSNVLPSDFGIGLVRANDINDNGEIVGIRGGTYPIYRYGFVYSLSTGLRVLPFPGAGYQQQVAAYGINNDGVVVGSFTNLIATEFAMVSTPSQGTRNLNNPAIVAGIPAGYILRTAMKINNNGWIIGNGSQGGKNTGWLLKPRGTICDDIDFNNDGSLFDPQDIDAFLSVYSEGPCVPDTATCSDIDFNNDTSVFDPCDIDSFLVVYSEGPCTACGQ